MVPAQPDARYHNRQPIYPREAAARGEQGAVLLLVHVGPDGSAMGVDVSESSGYRRLDEAAQDAVAAWHFLPALRDGAPADADTLVRVVFQLK